MLSAGMKQPFSSADERKVKPCTDDARRIPSALENCTSDLYRQSRFRMNRRNAPHVARSRGRCFRIVTFKALTKRVDLTGRSALRRGSIT
jgi:hypothetical protein